MNACRWHWIVSVGVAAGLLAEPAAGQEAGPEPSVTEEVAGDVIANGEELSDTDIARRCKKNYLSRRYETAISACNKALEKATRTGNTANAAAARYGIAIALDAQNQRGEALVQLRQSREEAIESGDQVIELYTLNREGTIYHSMGDPMRAIDLYTEAMEVGGAADGSTVHVHAQANRAASRLAVGDYYGALKDLDAVSAEYEALDHKAGKTSVQINYGLVHQALGDYRYAEESFERALTLAGRSPVDVRRVAEVQHNLGYLAGARADYAAAREHYARALESYDTDDRRRAMTLNNMGVAAGELGDYAAAEREIGESLQIARDNNLRIAEGRALDSLATVQAYEGQQAEAFANYQRALFIKLETNDREGQRQTLANIGGQLRAQDRLALATLFYKRSINVSEAIRSGLKPMSEKQQRSYAENVSDTYRELSDLLTQQNRFLEAQRVIDLLRVQEVEGYFGVLRGSEADAVGVPQTATETELLEGYDTLASRAVAIGRELTELREIPRGERTPEQNQRIDELEEMQQALDEELVRFINSDEVQNALDELEDRVGDEAIELSVLKNVGNQLKTLDHAAVVLYPLVLEDRLELILATPESRPIHRSVDVTRADLRSAVFEFLQALRNPSADARRPGKRLYDLVIAPVANELAQLQTIAILYAPDDALRYVPLSAFYDGNQWLIEKYRVSNWTDSSRINLVAPMAGDLRVIGGAYTVAGHSFTVGAETFSFSGLPFAGKEIETIGELDPDTLSFPGDDFVFDDLYRERQDFNVIHLATHAAVVVGQPSDSFILFGDGKRVSIQDIRALNFDLDLAVLSACETAVSGNAGKGVEVLGLGYAMQQSGVRSTIASLWPVSDGGTHALMSELYTQLEAGKSKSEALQIAQQMMIENDQSSIAAANRGLSLPTNVASRLSHPFYWAPFIIIGSGL